MFFVKYHHLSFLPFFRDNYGKNDHELLHQSKTDSPRSQARSLRDCCSTTLAHHLLSLTKITPFVGTTVSHVLSPANSHARAGHAAFLSSRFLLVNEACL